MTTNAFLGRKILITGGVGFIGSNLARRLVGSGGQVTLIDNMMSGGGGNHFNITGIENQVRLEVADLRDPGILPELVQRQDYLFNLAGQTGHLASMQEPFEDLDVNCRAQLLILEACRRYNPNVKIVFASTRQVYGKPRRLPVTEDHLIQPVDVNGINKVAAEYYHRLYNGIYGIKVCILRLTNTYGVRMRIKDSNQMFLGAWIGLLTTGKTIGVYGDGTQLRDLCHVEDVVDALMLAASRDEADGQVFNLGASPPVKLKDLAEILIEVNGGGDYELTGFPKERKAIDIGDFYADYGRINAVLGWAPKVSLRTGLAETIAYYREHAAQYLQADGPISRSVCRASRS